MTHTDRAAPATALEHLHSLADIEQAAHGLLPVPVRDFVAGGAGSELTLAANRRAFEATRIVPRALRDVSGCDPATTLLGLPAAMPVAVAPIGYHGLIHPDGELAAARAAKEAGIPFTVATLSSRTVEDVAAVAGTTWFQLYWLRDRATTFDLVRRAEDAGCAAVMLTVDVPWMGRRLRDVRNGFALPEDVVAANLTTGTASAAHRASAGASAVARHTAAAFDPSLSWPDLEKLRRRTRLPLIVKGVLDPADAARAAACGADAVVVSNHGGRQLDGAVPALEALPEVRAALPAACEVLLDSGVRGGVDILKALALGARGVLVGRPLLWGLAVAGTDGVRRTLDLLAAEFRDALGLAGCTDPSAATLLRTRRASDGGPSPW
ncbi:alpha-hydroxy acid oxidase [Streptomyces violaceochromogenes]|uniref:Alpha-hydroxy acid oxidase n=1 Tax=Streptomyces violaceochromogenes TaxID=67377 RepID=A0ABU6M8B1_9ACTN|nr:alpha-hydroxy acid oxidase [Streptomyces violaceochromogenes]MEC7057766.1 alpha-hydroxy acid oxidase [Streptomyces violaceochromogenes]GHC52243.1 alpha-hydroxy-acid oxidizing enzyme [Streptomyces violaceochromogenes]